MIEQAISNPRSPLALRQALGDVAAEIARIAPALRRVFPDIPPPVELPASWLAAMWNSFSEFIGRAAQGQPLLLVLEDLHWADESTVLLTEYLAPLLPEMPVLVLGTYRDAEVDLDHPLARVIGQLGHRRLVERVNLRRLSFDGVRAMLRALAGQPAPEQLVRVIDRETEGNPFFVEEVYLHLVESGVLLDEHGRVRADLQLDEVSVPESIRLVLGQRLDRLASATREVLVAAAVGQGVRPRASARLPARARTALVEVFDEAERARLIAPGKVPGELMFSHELIRQTLLSGVSAVKRERLHLRTAEAISRLYSDDLEAHAGDLAYHLSHAGRAGDRASLVRYLTIAGERAFDAAAFDDAVGYFEHALSLILNDDQLGRASCWSGWRWRCAAWAAGSALRTMNEALDRYEALGQVEAIGRLGWAMVYQLDLDGGWSRVRSGSGRWRHSATRRARTRPACCPRWRGRSASAATMPATATFDQARALAERWATSRPGRRAAHADHPPFRLRRVRRGSPRRPAGRRDVRAGECAVGSLQRAGVRDLRGRYARQSRAGDQPRRQDAGHRRAVGHLGAAFMVLWTGSARRRCSATCRRWRRSVRRFWTSASGADCRRYLGHLPGPGRALARRRTRRGSAAKRRRAGAAGRIRRAERFAAGAAPGLPRARRRGAGTLRVGPVEAAQPRPGQRHRLVELHARLR